MASIFNLTNQLLLINDLSKNMEEKCKNIAQTCLSFFKKIETSNKKIAKILYGSIKNKSVLITHSYSSTVYDSLIYLKAKGIDFNVVCTESRPMMEGVNLAENLGNHDIDVTLISDSAVFSFIEKADMIIVGADSLSKEGIVNKIGTKGLALASKMLGTNFYCICGLEKLYPLGIKKLKINEPKNPSEILDKKLKNVKPKNFYFDFTPLKYLSAIVTDAGFMKPEDLIKKFLNFRVHNFLK
jgi:translation initiation factor 2B subunit (eIF-2B alpha/beta/delta family)